MNNSYSNLAIVIPSLEPDDILTNYVKTLIKQGFIHIYIVNDGSSSKFDNIFQSLSNFDECTVLTHLQNKGKGYALKTAYKHIAENFEACKGIVTADSDGQHAVKDVCKIADKLLENTDGLLLGVRNFSKKGIPLKSWIGNRISSLIFFLFQGVWLQDTQTGLRGFLANHLTDMIDIAGDRFEYEMAVLTTFANNKMGIHSFLIDTIYIDDNESTHFRPFADSLRIGKVLFNRLCRFMTSSGISLVVDMSLCWFLLYILKNYISTDILRIGIAVTSARIVSMLVNYTINKKFVFKTNRQNSFIKYLILAITNMLAVTILINFGQSVLHIDERLAKLICDIIFFIINYQIQRIWVFKSQKGGQTIEQYSK